MVLTLVLPVWAEYEWLPLKDKFDILWLDFVNGLEDGIIQFS